MFRTIIISALLAGITSGMIYGLFQATQISPIIHAAEKYEFSKELDDNHDHHHDQQAWAPKDGLERKLFTLASTILTSISLAIILIALMQWHNLKSDKPRVTWLTGLGWGIALMLSFFVAPALFGLHPHVPGTQVAQLEHRQSWWLLCVIGTASGLAILYYAPVKFKLAGMILIAIPHIIGSPQLTSELSFTNSDPVAAQALTELSKQFYIKTSMGMLIFCLSLGALSGYSINKFRA